MNGSRDTIGGRRKRLRWDIVLVWYLRLLAIAWIAKGLLSWNIIFTGAFEGRSNSFQASVIYFSLIDVIAAVGLWLASAWGGVVWLLAVMSHLVLGTFFPRIFIVGPIGQAIEVGLIVVYLVLSWLAARQED